LLRLKKKRIENEGLGEPVYFERGLRATGLGGKEETALEKQGGKNALPRRREEKKAIANGEEKSFDREKEGVSRCVGKQSKPRRSFFGQHASANREEEVLVKRKRGLKNDAGRKKKDPKLRNEKKKLLRKELAPEDRKKLWGGPSFDQSRGKGADIIVSWGGKAGKKKTALGGKHDETNQREKKKRWKKFEKLSPHNCRGGLSVLGKRDAYSQKRKGGSSCDKDFLNRGGGQGRYFPVGQEAEKGKESLPILLEKRSGTVTKGVHPWPTFEKGRGEKKGG